MSERPSVSRVRENRMHGFERGMGRRVRSADTAPLTTNDTIGHCPSCPYREGPAIGHRGNPASRIVLVGEAPGAKEIAEGRLFVGPAGDVLWAAVAKAGLHEADVFVVNSLACRPHPVRPRVEAIVACRGRLVRYIAAYPRAVIVALAGPPSEPSPSSGGSSC